MQGSGSGGGILKGILPIIPKGLQSPLCPSFPPWILPLFLAPRSKRAPVFQTTPYSFPQHIRVEGVTHCFSIIYSVIWGPKCLRSCVFNNIPASNVDLRSVIFKPTAHYVKYRQACACSPQSGSGLNCIAIPFEILVIPAKAGIPSVSRGRGVCSVGSCLGGNDRT